MSIQKWMPVLEEKINEIEGLTGVRSAWKQDGNDPGLPGTIQEFPMVLIIPLSGATQYSAGGPYHDFTNVLIAFYTSAGLLPEAMDIAVPFIQKFRDKLASNIQLEGTVDHILPPDPPADWFQGPGAIDYGGKIYTGINFFYGVKENTASEITTVAA